MKNQNHSQNNFNPLSNPFQQLMELNFKTLQSFAALTPIELIKTPKHEESFKKGVNMFIQNGHRYLDHLHNIFEVMESSWSNTTSGVARDSNQTMSQVQKQARDIIKDALRAGESAAKKARPAAKKTKKAPSSMSKTILTASKSVKKPVKTVSRNKKVAKPDTTKLASQGHKSKMTAAKLASQGHKSTATVNSKKVAKPTKSASHAQKSTNTNKKTVEKSITLSQGYNPMHVSAAVKKPETKNIPGSHNPSILHKKEPTQHPIKRF